MSPVPSQMVSGAGDDGVGIKQTITHSLIPHLTLGMSCICDHMSFLKHVWCLKLSHKVKDHISVHVSFLIGHFALPSIA